MSDARDVIAEHLKSRWTDSATEEEIDNYWGWWESSADAILAALHAAGYEIVKRDAPIQKPEPDWGRRGTQPKGTLGDPPPPNGKRVASKPLPPTPGPFNPFGKQDDV